MRAEMELGRPLTAGASVHVEKAELICVLQLRDTASRYTEVVRQPCFSLCVKLKKCGISEREIEILVVLTASRYTDVTIKIYKIHVNNKYLLKRLMANATLFIYLFTRLMDRFPMKSLGFSIDIILSTA
jgi:hypothetical protein